MRNLNGGLWPEQIGDLVRYVDESGRAWPALVTAIFGYRRNPSLNLVFVNPDVRYTDPYGRQILRVTHVVHETQQAGPGRFWQPWPVEGEGDPRQAGAGTGKE